MSFGMWKTSTITWRFSNKEVIIKARKTIKISIEQFYDSYYRAFYSGWLPYAKATTQGWKLVGHVGIMQIYSTPMVGSIF